MFVRSFVRSFARRRGGRAGRGRRGRRCHLELVVGKPALGIAVTTILQSVYFANILQYCTEIIEMLSTKKSC